MAAAAAGTASAVAPGCAQGVHWFHRESHVRQIDFDAAYLGEQRFLNAERKSALLFHAVPISRLIQSQRKTRTASAVDGIDPDGLLLLVRKERFKLLAGGFRQFEHCSSEMLDCFP